MLHTLSNIVQYGVARHSHLTMYRCMRLLPALPHMRTPLNPHLAFSLEVPHVAQTSTQQNLSNGSREKQHKNKPTNRFQLHLSVLRFFETHFDRCRRPWRARLLVDISLLPLARRPPLLWLGIEFQRSRGPTRCVDSRNHKHTNMIILFC